MKRTPLNFEEAWISEEEFLKKVEALPKLCERIARAVSLGDECLQKYAKAYDELCNEAFSIVGTLSSVAFGQGVIGMTASDTCGFCDIYEEVAKPIKEGNWLPYATALKECWVKRMTNAAEYGSYVRVDYQMMFHKAWSIWGIN